jgi:hypothetical protein
MTQRFLGGLLRSKNVPVWFIFTMKVFSNILGISLLAFLTFVAIVDVKPSSSILRSEKIVDTEIQRDMKSKDINTLNSIRIATFGSSRSWGAAIEHPERDSFSALLGARNLAIRASGPEFPAVCTYSMLGDEVYDAFVIEYMLNFVSPALDVLAERLRNRFPEATIIFLNIWAPRQYSHTPTQQTLKAMTYKKYQYHSNFTALDYVNQVMAETKPEDWEFEPYNRKIIEDVASKVGGWIIDLPRDDDPISALSYAVPLYAHDLTHFSELGHLWVRDRILVALSKTGSKNVKKVLPWEYTDQCSSWFQTGKTDLKHNMEMVDFGSGTKFALETRSPPQKNIVEIENEWDTAAYLYVSFMVNGPEHIYPEVLITVDQHGNQSSAQLVRPFFDITPLGGTLHVVNHMLVGNVNRGKSQVTITELTTGQKEHFRLVGVMMSLLSFGNSIFAAI